MSLLKMLFNSVIIVIFTFIIFELSLRFIDPKIVGQIGPNKLHIVYRDFGPWFKANQKSTYFAKSIPPCFISSPITINQHGMRNKRVSLEKKDNYRIAVLGDSVTEGLQVKDFKYSTSIIEKKLNKIDNEKKYEILNFAFSGYGTAQQLIQYKHFVYKFDPDFTYIIFTSSNDFRNNKMELDYIAYGKDISLYKKKIGLPFSYVDIKDGELIEILNIRKNSNTKTFLKNILYNFYSVSLLYNKYLEYKGRNNIIKIQDTELSNENIDINNSKFKEENIENLNNISIYNTYFIIKEFKRITNNKIAFGIFNDNDENTNILKEILNLLNIKFIEFGYYGSNKFTDYLKKHNLSSKDTHFKCDHHPNELGHKLIGEISSNFLYSLINNE